MFDFKSVKGSHVVNWMELDGMEVEVVLTDHAQERMVQRDVSDVDVYEAIQSLENRVLDMGVGDIDKLVSNSVGVSFACQIESVVNNGNYYIRLVVHTVYRNNMYMRVRKYR